jgi:hypothetical protein
MAIKTRIKRYCEMYPYTECSKAWSKVVEKKIKCCFDDLESCANILTVRTIGMVVVSIEDGGQSENA